MQCRSQCRSLRGLPGVLVVIAALGGCASSGVQPGYSGTSAAPVSNYSSSNGVVETIQVVNTEKSGTSGAGAVIGGLVGGVLGNQVGGGTGNAVATVAGAVGGAVVGNSVEKNNRHPETVYHIGVRFDNGAYQTIAQTSVGDLRVGERVHVENNRIYRN